MKIQINEDYKIETDALNIILMKKRVIQKENSINFGQEHYTIIGYYSNLKSALMEMVKLGIMDSDLVGVNQVIDKLNKIEKMLDNATRGMKDILKQDNN